jgi:hypothetical protein
MLGAFYDVGQIGGALLKKHRILVLVAVAAALVLLVAGVRYSRPLTIEALCPEVPLERCRTIWVTATEWVTDTEGNILEDRLSYEWKLTPDDPQFDRFIQLFEGQAFRRSLSSLLGDRTKMHLLRANDIQWQVSFDCGELTLSTGESVSGYTLRVSNFFGTLDMNYLDQYWRIRADDELWISQVSDAIRAA